MSNAQFKRRVQRNGAAGFTLIELLLVMMIIAILAAVVVPKFAGQSEKARIAAAQHDVSTIKTQLDAFEIQNGRYPTAEEGLNALVVNPGNLPNWTRYLDKLPMDPWQHAYIYHFPGANDHSYDLYSSGPDGQDGTADDIGDTNRQ
jgi:general secretion pathway protein G